MLHKADRDCAGGQKYQNHYGPPPSTTEQKEDAPMSSMEIAAKARELTELKRMPEELEAEITTLEDALKSAMGDQEQVIAGAYKLTWKPVTSARVDTTAFKKAMPELAERFTKTTTTRRFLVA